MKKDKNKVYLVGAGPGNPDLITLAGVKALNNADAILYDALVNKEILEHAGSDVPKTYVGKLAGHHYMKQDEINALIAEYVGRYGSVVRLKGGDPFVFGRATEEIDYLRERGIDVEVIPGVSSAIAAPSACGVPLTSRGISTGFWVITATTKCKSLNQDLLLCAQSSATIVILMGVRKFKEIVDKVRLHRSDDTPIALVQNGTMDTQQIHVGTLGECDHIVENRSYEAPGIIVVGEVVAQSPAYLEYQLQQDVEHYVKTGAVNSLHIPTA